MNSSTKMNRQLAISAAAGFVAVLFLGTSALADPRDHHPAPRPVHHAVRHVVHHVVHRPIHH